MLYGLELLYRKETEMKIERTEKSEYTTFGKLEYGEAFNTHGKDMIKVHRPYSDNAYGIDLLTGEVESVHPNELIVPLDAKVVIK